MEKSIYEKVRNMELSYEEIEQKVQELEAKAEKWDIIRKSFFFDCLKEMYEGLDTAQVECSYLQQFVINSIEELGDNATDLLHVRHATQRLMDITNAMYYNKEDFGKLLD